MSKSHIKGDKKGYTLVEVIVVCVIIGIMSTMAIGGLMAYQKYANFKKNNEYAQTIFSAAQSSMTSAVNDGIMEDLTNQIDLDNGTGTGYKPLTASMLVDSTVLDEYTGKNDRIYTFVFHKGDTLGNYTGAQRIIYNMIVPYVYDSTILDATYCVEVDASNGVVLGVCYNDKATSFYYAGESASSKEAMDISNRDRDKRKELELGYYGADSATASIPEAAKPTYTATLRNENTLNLFMELEDAKDLGKPFSIEVQSGSGKHVVISVAQDSVLTRIKSNAETAIAGYQNKQSDLKVSASVTMYDADGTQIGEPDQTMDFPAYFIDGASSIVFALDAVDLASAVDSGDLTKTYSIKRLGFNEHDYLTATVKMGDSVQTSNTENALFGNADKDSYTEKDQVKTYTYDILNARNLYNIRFLENAIDYGLSHTNEEDYKDYITNHYVYQQKADFAWLGETTADAGDGLVTEFCLYNSQKVVNIGNQSNNDQRTFAAIPTLSIHSAYQGALEENNKTTQYHIYNLVVNDSQRAGNEPAPIGMFGQNNGRIEGVSVTGSVVTGNNLSYVGTICGINNGVLQDCSVEDNGTGTKDAITSSTVTGLKYVGGIVGTDASAILQEVEDEGEKVQVAKTGATRSYEALINEADVTATASKTDAYAGGILGYINGVKTEESTVSLLAPIAHCTNRGNVISENGYCVGGIVGYNEGTSIQDCKIEKKEKTQDEILLDGYTKVGGIAGYNGFKVGIIDDNNGTISTCTVSNMIIKRKVENNSQKDIISIGGLVGENTGRITQSKDNTRCSIKASTINVKLHNKNQDGRIGGVVGYNHGSRALVSGCDVGTFEQDKRTEGLSLTTSYAHTGGVVGYNEDEGKITDCNTYDSIQAKTNSSVGIGGIAGFSNSKEEISGHNNYMEVSVEAGNASVGTGGILGLGAGTVKISSCNNFGGVRVDSTNNCFAGGILGINYGKAVIAIDNCMNTATIYSKDGAGIYAGERDGEEVTSTITHCRNYGVGSKDKNYEMSGIFGRNGNEKVNNDTTTLTNNFGVAQNKYNITGSGISSSSKDNFTFAREERKFAIADFRISSAQSASGSGSIQNTKNSYSDMFGSAIEDSGKRFSFDSYYAPRLGSKQFRTATMEFDFERPVKLQSVAINWYGDWNSLLGTVDRKYTYEVEYRDANGAYHKFDQSEYKATGRANYKSDQYVNSTMSSAQTVTGVRIKVTKIENLWDWLTGDITNISIWDMKFSSGPNADTDGNYPNAGTSDIAQQERYQNATILWVPEDNSNHYGYNFTAVTGLPYGITQMKRDPILTDQKDGAVYAKELDGNKDTDHTIVNYLYKTNNERMLTTLPSSAAYEIPAGRSKAIYTTFPTKPEVALSDASGFEGTGSNLEYTLTLINKGTGATYGSEYIVKDPDTGEDVIVATKNTVLTLGQSKKVSLTIPDNMQELVKNHSGTVKVTLLDDAGNVKKTVATIDVTKVLPQSQNAPVLGKAFTQNNGLYTFTWDDSKNQADNGEEGLKIPGKDSYEVTLTGTNLDGTTKVLYYNDSLEQNQLTIDGSSWRYVNLNLKVTRLGEDNMFGTVTTFGATSEMDYDIDLPLSAIGAPEITRKDNNRDELIYQVTYQGITDSQEIDALAGYTIGVLDQKTGEELLTQTSQTDSADINMEDLQGRKVTIYVVANAREESDIYTDSLYTATTDFEVPTRLQQPLAESIVMDQTYSKDQALTEEEFTTTGLDISVQNATEEEGTYLLEGRIYKDKERTQEVTSFSQKMSGDLKASAYRLKGLEVSYAGYYIALRIQSTSDNSTSSLWSEDAVFRLPRVQAASPNVQMTTLTVDSVDRDGLAWSFDERIKTYLARITELPEEGKETGTSYETRIRVNQGDENPFTVEYLSKDENGEDLWQPISEPVITRVPADNTPMGTLRGNAFDETTGNTAGSKATTIYSYPIAYEKIVKDGTGEDKKLAASIECIAQTVDNQTTYAFHIVLPDVTTKDGLSALGRTEEEPYRYTSEVTVKGQVTDQLYYADTRSKKWSRVPEFDQSGTFVWNTKTEEVE